MFVHFKLAAFFQLFQHAYVWVAGRSTSVPLTLALRTQAAEVLLLMLAISVTKLAGQTHNARLSLRQKFSSRLANLKRSQDSEWQTAKPLSAEKSQKPAPLQKQEMDTETIGRLHTPFDFVTQSCRVKI